MLMHASDYVRGIALSVFTVLGLSCDSLLVKLAARDGVSLPMGLTFKTMFAAATLSTLLAARAAISGQRVNLSLRGSWPPSLETRHVLVGVFFFFFQSIAFTMGFSLTTAANMLALTSLSPFWAALYAWPVLGKRPNPRIMAAAALGFTGSIVVLVGVVLAETGLGQRSQGRNVVAGSFMGVMGGLCLAGWLTTAQSVGVRAPTTPIGLVPPIGFALSGCFGLALVPWLHPAGEPLVPPNQRAMIWPAVNGTCCMSLTFIAAQMATRLVPSAEVALILTLEGVMGPLLTYFVLGEVPTMLTLIGGAIVLCAVITNATVAIVVDRRQQRTSRDKASDEGALESVPAVEPGHVPASIGDARL